MITSMQIRNFKRFRDVTIEFGSPVVFVGPNNSGKTTALQALSLWYIGLKKWVERRGFKGLPEKRPGVTINKKDLFSIPVPDANNLWRDMHVRNVQTVDGKKSTTSINIEIIVHGVTNTKDWVCGLEFDYANPESFYCRPLRMVDEVGQLTRMPVPMEASEVQVAFLLPMSGLISAERKIDPGAINVLIGEGRTAEVLRNLCHIVFDDKVFWDSLCKHMELLFGVYLLKPEYIVERGEIVMRYVERSVEMDIAMSGRGLQQTLLLLAYIYSRGSSIMLLDEPDAHLEILRQRQIYQTINDVAEETKCQVVIASHSEVILDEAIDKDIVIGFIGQPHCVNDKRAEVAKALKEIGFEHYFQAEKTGWVLYLEGSTDLAILREFAKKLNHEGAQAALRLPYVHYVSNNPTAAQSHFFGLREAVPHLAGCAIFDRLERGLPDGFSVINAMIWKKREIESYLCTRETLVEYAKNYTVHGGRAPLLSYVERENNIKHMDRAIEFVSSSLLTLREISPWSDDTKVSDDFLTPLFREYFKGLGRYNVMAKKSFSELVQFVPREQISTDISDALDMIATVARHAVTASQD